MGICPGADVHQDRNPPKTSVALIRYGLPTHQCPVADDVILFDKGAVPNSVKVDAHVNNPKMYSGQYGVKHERPLDVPWLR